ncbi:hypothetical protein OCOJLMKI_5292 [Methylobacterium iners]|uniref:Tc1-like transposase DDE domain-containing protein n=1 Tax=Methylobacterium iners TaxID=418707 RepID=A0ABQ4S6E0_9HYPH|nr:hypothetical protein OCOJLMKI_5292 [Methylobacterium iners]
MRVLFAIDARVREVMAWVMLAYQRAVETAGASLLYLPPSSLHFNPIENAFAKLKSLLCKAAERTVGALWDRIDILFKAFTPAECANYFRAAGCAFMKALKRDNARLTILPG